MGWRGKLICLLFFYCAGFATAIYCLAPVSEEQNAIYAQKGFPYTATKSDQFAKSFGIGLHKFIAFSKAAASETINKIKQKTGEKPNNASVQQTAGLHR